MTRLKTIAIDLESCATRLRVWADEDTDDEELAESMRVVAAGVEASARAVRLTNDHLWGEGES